nr:MAG TPA: hypothetical protein [Caudoviricetes sp.]
MKKVLTIQKMAEYTESLKTSLRGFRTRQICDFFVFAYGRMRAENISNIGQSIRKLAFSESARHSILSGFLKKVYEMTNTIINTTESTLQSLYRYYSEMAKTWYKGNYTIDQETIYGEVFNTLENALIKLPIQGPEDRKIKLALLQDIIKSPLLDNNNQIHPENDSGAMLALTLCEQLAGE